ncbi:MAG: tetratricopeptide repeat protein [Acidobacteriota bacterium]|nr:tetratricopeptide repeat protein [Acidobacteriota bacterium]
MKRCPTCNRTFEDTLTYCLVDGSILSAPFDPTEQNNDAPATEVMPQGVSLAETQSQVVQTAAPTIPAMSQPTPISAEQPSRSEQKPNQMLWVVGSIALLALIGVAFLIFRGGAQPQTSNQQLAANTTTNTSSNTASPTPDKTADEAKAHYSKGKLFKEEKRYAEAETEFREAIRLNPNDVTNHAALAEVLSRQSKMAEAEKEYREILRLKPDAEPHYAAAVHYNLGKALGDEKKYAESEAEYREAIRLDPNLGSAHMNLGLVLFWQNRVTEAESELREAVRLSPNDSKSHYNLAVVLEKEGKSSESKAEYAKAEQLKDKKD